MEIQADLEESEIFSLSRRPFQEANETGKIVCCKCFEVEKVFHFFDKEKGLKQHFRIIHHGIELSNLIFDECKTLFQRQHGEETVKVIQQLTNLRLNLTVSKLIKLFCVFFIQKAGVVFFTNVVFNFYNFFVCRLAIIQLNKCILHIV